MSPFAPPISPLHPTEGIDQGVITDISQRHSSRTTSIHILDDDSLLNIFYLYRPAVTVTDEDENYDGNRSSIITGGEWDHENHWWYKPAHVCRRWRNLILESASFLDVYLVCTPGTPVADMLANSPPIPLVIDHRDRNIAAEDEGGIFFALKQPNRIRRIRVMLSSQKFQKFVMAIDEEFPILEYLVLESRGDGTMTFPETIRAPHLRHLVLDGVASPIASRLLISAMGLVTLHLVMYYSSSNINPNSLLQLISPLSQLETLEVTASVLQVNRDAEMHTPTITHTTLPNLRWLSLQGVIAYLEVLVHRIAAPRLERLHIAFYEHLTNSIPCIVWIMNTENKKLRSDSAKFEFADSHVRVESLPYDALYFHPDQWCYPCSFGISNSWMRINGHISSMSQIVDALGQVLSVVEHLILDREVYYLSPGQGFEVEVDRTELHKLLRPFVNVKSLRVNHRLVKEFSRSLQLDDGELPLEILPELQELTYSAGSFDVTFASFIDARQNAGHPVSLVRHSPSSSTSE